MKYVIVGGTGTLGTELVKRLIVDRGNEVVVLSRDEFKQQRMSMEFKSDNLKFRLGDIRDRSALSRAFRSCDFVFHVAALKHVDVLEANPDESVATNVLGTQNVADVAIECGVKRVVFSSTDKAVAPVNVYGMSKALSEKILLNRNSSQDATRFVVFRWGNVIGSRGSAIEGFVRTLKEERRAYITDPGMTRFWIRIEDAVDFMLSNFMTGSGVLIPPIKCASVYRVIQATASLLGIDSFEEVITGGRPGERLHELLNHYMRSDAWEEYGKKELYDLIAPEVSALA